MSASDATVLAPAAEQIAAYGGQLWACDRPEGKLWRRDSTHWRRLDEHGLQRAVSSTPAGIIIVGDRGRQRRWSSSGAGPIIDTRITEECHAVCGLPDGAVVATDDQLIETNLDGEVRQVHRVEGVRAIAARPDGAKIAAAVTSGHRVVIIDRRTHCHRTVTHAAGRALRFPRGVAFVGRELAIADTENRRVVIHGGRHWNLSHRLGYPVALGVHEGLLKVSVPYEHVVDDVARVASDPSTPWPCFYPLGVAIVDSEVWTTHPAQGTVMRHSTAGPQVLIGGLADPIGIVPGDHRATALVLERDAGAVHLVGLTGSSKVHSVFPSDSEPRAITRAANGETLVLTQSPPAVWRLMDSGCAPTPFVEFSASTGAPRAMASISCGHVVAVDDDPCPWLVTDNRWIRLPELPEPPVAMARSRAGKCWLRLTGQATSCV